MGNSKRILRRDPYVGFKIEEREWIIIDKDIKGSFMKWEWIECWEQILMWVKKLSGWKERIIDKDIHIKEFLVKKTCREISIPSSIQLREFTYNK